ncbi:MAG TPA: universal stress protein, partial [Candidatus Didemnitutus sp.]|nr:universal stress protein [Candidatus Didemnitutus sp.]
MKTILVPVDLSEATVKVCDAACSLAKLLKARLVLLHVVQPPPVIISDYYGYDAGVIAEAMGSAEKFATDKLRALGQRYAKRRVTVRTVQRTGQPLPTILTKASVLNADYIVIGSHGHTAAYDLLIGSVTQGVLRKASCP